MPRRAWMENHLEPAERLGRQVIAGLGEPQGFVRRRTETIELLSYELVRRSVVVELALDSPADWRWEPSVPESPLLVPVGLLRKQALRHFEVVEGDEPVSSLRAAETARLLSLAAESLSGRLATDGRLEALERVILESPGDEDLATALELVPDASFGVLVMQLAEAFILLVELPPQQGPATRLVTYRLDEPYLTVPRSRAGFEPTRYRLPVLGAELCASFHAEVVIPEEARASRAQLQAGSAVLDADDEADRPSLHSPRRLRREDRTVVLVDVLTQRPVFYTPALTLASTELVLLGAGAIGAFAGQDYQGAAVPLLFATFAAITGLVIRAGESPLVRAMLTGGRIALVVSSALMLVAAAMVAAGASSLTLAVGWMVLATLSVPSLLVLALGWRLARPGVDAGGPRPQHRPNVD